MNSIAKIVDFCIVEFQGKQYEIETMKILDRESEYYVNVSINGIDMVMSYEDVDELFDDMLK